MWWEFNLSVCLMCVYRVCVHWYNVHTVYYRLMRKLFHSDSPLCANSDLLIFVSIEVWHRKNNNNFIVPFPSHSVRMCTFGAFELENKQLFWLLCQKKKKHSECVYFLLLYAMRRRQDHVMNTSFGGFILFLIFSLFWVFT